MKKMLNNSEINESIKILIEAYPNPACGLNFKNSFELLISLILAAQCTDDRVNLIVPKLLEKYPTPEAIINAGINEVYSIIKSCSFPNNKSKHVVNACETLVRSFNSIVPHTMDELLTIPGIGRKSANILLTDAFGITCGIAVDTHVTRLAKRIGYTNSTEPEQIEKDLMKKIPRKYWSIFNHILVEHGKTICVARKPNCSACVLKNVCREPKDRD